MAHFFEKKYSHQGCCSGLVVSVLAFYSVNLNANPAEVQFLCKIVAEKNVITKNRPI